MQMSGVFVLNNNAVMNASLRAETGVTVQSSCWAYICPSHYARAIIWHIYMPSAVGGLNVNIMLN